MPGLVLGIQHLNPNQSTPSITGPLVNPLRQ